MRFRFLAPMAYRGTGLITAAPVLANALTAVAALCRLRLLAPMLSPRLWRCADSLARIAAQ